MHDVHPERPESLERSIDAARELRKARPNVRAFVVVPDVADDDEDAFARDVGGFDVRAATQRELDARQSRSTIVTFAWPPPSHIVWRP